MAITVRVHKDLMEVLRQLLTKLFHVWKDMFRENAECLTNSVTFDRKKDKVKTSVERNLVSTRIKKHVRVLQTMLSSYVDKMTTSTAVTKNFGSCSRLVL